MDGAPKSMEGVPKSEVIKNPENAVEVAKELYEKLQAYKGTNVIGREAFNEVESLARALGEVLRGLSVQERLEAGLPWHPYEAQVAANDDNYAVAA